MNRHERRSLNSIHRKFQDSLPQKIEPPKVTETKARFFNMLADKQQKGEMVDIAYGVMSEHEGANAYIEEIVYPPEGGCELKLWGIDYRLKLNRQGMKLHAFDLAKSLVSGIPREIIGSSLPVSLAFCFEFLFRPKKTIQMLDNLFFTILHRTLRWIEIPLNELNPAPREIRRASIAVLKQMGFDLDAYKFGPKGADDFTFPLPDGTVKHLLAELILFVVFFLEVDMAYRLRVQDAFRGDLMDGLETMIVREVEGQGIAHKWKWLKLILRFGLWRYGDINLFVKGVMREIDWDKVKMDEADRFFSLGYISYNFEGRSFDDRWAERIAINNTRSHIIFFA